MPLEKLEPLYRWLRYRNGKDAFNELLTDMAVLAKEGYIQSSSNGTHAVHTSTKINSEISTILQADIGTDTRMSYQFQAIGDVMYINAVRIEMTTNRTVLSLKVTGSDEVTVEYLDFPGLIGTFNVFSSINSILPQDDGTYKRGFLRTQVTQHTDENRAVLKIDFRLSRTKPFFILVKKGIGTEGAAHIGDVAEAGFNDMAGV